ncbi:MAG: hypothetical protein JNK82_43790 [Myxococcaceae bacterium]|nr:hypothetical protein [Myxococcaceae bacterium]
MADPDPQADFGLYWSDAVRMRIQQHGSHSVELLQKTVKGGGHAFLCVVAENGRFEGFIAMDPDGRVTGTLVAREHESFRINIEHVDGGADDLMELTARLLDYDFKFPEGIGVTADTFKWAKPPQ